MQRQIAEFVNDADGEWIAVLGCGHRQHVRHNPPFMNRPWVTTEQGRSGKLGAALNCLRCDRFEMPEGFVAYKRTPVFTEASVPAGLRKDHSTKAGVWAKIVVTEGRLRYRADASDKEMDLSPGRQGIVVPEVLHRVEPLGRVRFFVEFYRAPDRSA